MKVLVATHMYPSPNRPAFGVFVKEQVDSLKDAGVDVDVLVFDGKGGVKGYLAAARVLRQTLHKRPYDLVHAHYGLTGLVGRMQIRCPLVVTFHGSDLLGGVGSQYRYTLLGRVVATVSKLAGLVATSRIVVADILKSELWFRSAVTIPMGVDLSLFKPMSPQKAREQLKLDHSKKRVLFVAHPSNRIKRFDVARGAVQLLQEVNPDVELLPVYNVPHHQIPLYMNACDVLVLTSMHEASPCVVKEAMACNLPIVSVKVGDVAERIDGIAGCYLCRRTPLDVSAKLHQALEYGHRTNGRERIQSLSLQNVAQKVISVYQETQRAQVRSPQR
jgi:glycosyltransferase involved in cell wall biosynthesis